MVIVGIQNSIAYFTAESSVENVFTIGNVKIELTETKWDSNMEHIIDANASFDKNPVVKNVGYNPAYVRLSVNVSHVSNLQNAINKTGFVPKDLFGGEKNHA